MDISLCVPSPDCILGSLLAFVLVDVSLSVPSPDWVLEALVALLLVDVSLSVLDLHALAVFLFVDVSV